MKSIGISATVHFKGEKVHEFESYPTEPLSSLFQADTSLSHTFSGQVDGGAMADLKNSGPFALLTRAIIVRYVIQEITQ